MSKKQKQMFALQWAKVHVQKYLDQVVGAKFSHLEVLALQETVHFKVYLFPKITKKFLNKKQISEQIKRIYNLYVKSFFLSISYLDLPPADALKNPKYYFERFRYAYQQQKVNPFNYTVKIENSNLAQCLNGMRVIVSGKRGARKFTKKVQKGTICHHSPKKGVLQKYKGTLQTPLGTLGITVITQPK